MCVVCVHVSTLSLSLSTLAHKFVLVWTAACDRVKHVVVELRNYMILDCCLLLLFLLLACRYWVWHSCIISSANLVEEIDKGFHVMSTRERERERFRTRAAALKL